MRMSEIIQRAIELGKQTGRISFGDLDRITSSLIPADGLELQHREIEMILNSLNEAGIHVEEDEEGTQ